MPPDQTVQAAPGVGASGGKASGGAPVRVHRLVYHLLDTETVALVVAPDEVVTKVVLPFGRAAVARDVAALRRALDVDAAPRGLDRTPERARAGVGVDVGPILARWYRRLVAPLEAALPEPDSLLAVEPHGPLWLLPFGALPGPDGVPLGARFALVHTPSADVLGEVRRQPAYAAPVDRRYVLVGNPAYGLVHLPHGVITGVRPLPGAEAEVRRIAELIPETRRRVLAPADATVDNVLEAARWGRVLHLGTHGIAYADDPLASCVILARSEGDELLTAARVMETPLALDLVALSACQTGLGKVAGDGVIGLTRAFLVAGARSVLASLWSVSDEATEALVVRFYTEWLSGRSKAEALSRALDAVRRTPGFEHPRFWAPFLLVGAET